jgi:hypothetical protein
MGIYDVFGTSHSFDKKEWAAKKQSQRKSAYEIIENTCTKLIAGGDLFRQYLNVQGRFDRYSVNNAILVAAQFPEATQLKDWTAWKQNRVYINRDAQKITILEPGKEYTRDDGSKAVSYNTKIVYDVSQTSAALSQAAKKASPAEKKSMRELVAALIDASPVPFQPVKELEIPVFYDSNQQVIFVRQGLAEAQLFAGMAKETAAAVFALKCNESRAASEFSSYCVTYMLSSRYGVDTKGFHFDHIPDEWAKMDVQAIKKELGNMRDVLGEIQSQLYKSLEKNKPPRNKEQER